MTPRSAAFFICRLAFDEQAEPGARTLSEIAARDKFLFSYIFTTVAPAPGRETKSVASMPVRLR